MSEVVFNLTPQILEENQKRVREDFEKSEKKRASRRKSYNKHKDRILQERREKYKNDPRPKMIVSARARAKRDGRSFDITKSDISVPNYCPVLGIKLEVSEGKFTDSSPSLDRIDNSKGYVKGNIQVISNRANALKKDATVEELEALLDYMRKNT